MLPELDAAMLNMVTGNRITPSWVAFTDEERLVGDAAKNQYASNPYRTIFDIVSTHCVRVQGRN
jgi:molecular chaperone DnaK (HSP70)